MSIFAPKSIINWRQGYRPLFHPKSSSLAMFTKTGDFAPEELVIPTFEKVCDAFLSVQNEFEETPLKAGSHYMHLIDFLEACEKQKNLPEDSILFLKSLGLVEKSGRAPSNTRSIVRASYNSKNSTLRLPEFTLFDQSQK